MMKFIVVFVVFVVLLFLALPYYMFSTTDTVLYGIIDLFYSYPLNFSKLVINDSMLYLFIVAIEWGGIFFLIKKGIEKILNKKKQRNKQS